MLENLSVRIKILLLTVVMLFIMELFMERLMISATSTAAGMKAISIPIALFGIYIAEVFSLRNSITP